MEIIDGYTLGPGDDHVSAIIVARRLSIADTPLWRVDTGTGQVYHSDRTGSGSRQKCRWTTGCNDAQIFQTTRRTDLWKPTIWQQPSFLDFYTAKWQTPGQLRALVREHVSPFQYKCPVDGRPGDPNLRLINHRSGVLIQKHAFESDTCRHYTGHHAFKFMASVDTLKKVHKVCRLRVKVSSTLLWNTDC